MPGACAWCPCPQQRGGSGGRRQPRPAAQVDMQPRPGSKAAPIGRLGGVALPINIRRPRLLDPSPARTSGFKLLFLPMHLSVRAGVCVCVAARCGGARRGSRRQARDRRSSAAPADRMLHWATFLPSEVPVFCVPRARRHPGVYVTLLDVFDNPGMKVGKRDSSSQFQKIDS